MRNKYEIIKDVGTAIALLEKTKCELQMTGINEHGDVRPSSTGDYSLEKIKRNCTTVRDLILDVRKGCEW